MFKLSDKAAIKIDELLIFDHQEMIEYLEKNQIFFTDLVLEYSPSKHTAYGYNSFGHLIKISFINGLVQKIVLVKDKPLKKRIKMVIAYDGSQFHGFQYQSKQRSIQGELSHVINPMIGENELIQGASRTDSFVHAKGQVIHFDTDLDISPSHWKTILNHQLPKDIYIKDVFVVHPLFHSRYDVFKKKYIYKIHLGEYDPLLANYYHFDQNLDIELMKRELKVLEGTHDFTSFSKSVVDDPIRTIYKTDIVINNNVLTIEIIGNGFLRYMVRIIVEYLLKIGKNQTSISMKEVLDSKSRKHTMALASPQALYLDYIEY